MEGATGSADTTMVEHTDDSDFRNSRTFTNRDLLLGVGKDDAKFEEYVDVCLKGGLPFVEIYGQLYHRPSIRMKFMAQHNIPEDDGYYVAERIRKFIHERMKVVSDDSSSEETKKEGSVPAQGAPMPTGSILRKPTEEEAKRLGNVDAVLPISPGINLAEAAKLSGLPEELLAVLAKSHGKVRATAVPSTATLKSVTHQTFVLSFPTEIVIRHEYDTAKEPDAVKSKGAKVKVNPQETEPQRRDAPKPPKGYKPLGVGRAIALSEPTRKLLEQGKFDAFIDNCLIYHEDPKSIVRAIIVYNRRFGAMEKAFSLTEEFQVDLKARELVAERIKWHKERKKDEAKKEKEPEPEHKPPADYKRTVLNGRRPKLSRELQSMLNKGNIDGFIAGCINSGFEQYRVLRAILTNKNALAKIREAVKSKEFFALDLWAQITVRTIFKKHIKPKEEQEEKTEPKSDRESKPPKTPAKPKPLIKLTEKQRAKLQARIEVEATPKPGSRVFSARRRAEMLLAMSLASSTTAAAKESKVHVSLICHALRCFKKDEMLVLEPGYNLVKEKYVKPKEPQTKEPEEKATPQTKPKPRIDPSDISQRKEWRSLGHGFAPKSTTEMDRALSTGDIAKFTQLCMTKRWDQKQIANAVLHSEKAVRQVMRDHDIKMKDEIVAKVKEWVDVVFTEEKKRDIQQEAEERQKIAARKIETSLPILFGNHGGVKLSKEQTEMLNKGDIAGFAHSRLCELDNHHGRYRTARQVAIAVSSNQNAVKHVMRTQGIEKRWDVEAAILRIVEPIAQELETERAEERKQRTDATAHEETAREKTPSVYKWRPLGRGHVSSMTSEQEAALSAGNIEEFVGLSVEHKKPHQIVNAILLNEPALTYVVREHGVTQDTEIIAKVKQLVDAALTSLSVQHPAEPESTRGPSARFLRGGRSTGKIKGMPSMEELERDPTEGAEGGQQEFATESETTAPEPTPTQTPAKARREIVPEPDAQTLLKSGQIDAFVGAMLRHDINLTEEELKRTVTCSEAGRNTIKQAYGVETIGQINVRAGKIIHNAYRKHLRDICGPDAVPDTPKLAESTSRSTPRPEQHTETVAPQPVSSTVQRRSTYKTEPGDLSIGNEAYIISRTIAISLMPCAIALAK